MINFANFPKFIIWSSFPWKLSLDAEMLWKTMEKTRHFIIYANLALWKFYVNHWAPPTAVVFPPCILSAFGTRAEEESSWSVVNEMMWSVRWTPIVPLSCSYSLVKPRVSTVKTTLHRERKRESKGGTSLYTKLSGFPCTNNYLNEWTHILLICQHANFSIWHALQLKLCVRKVMKAFYISIAIV